MSKPRFPGRYIVYHSSFGEKHCDTLKEARAYVAFVEMQCPQYSPCIYDTKEEVRIL